MKRTIANRFKPRQPVYNRLYQIVCDKRVLLTAYSHLRKNRGDTTSGYSKKDIDGVSSSIGTSTKLLEKLSLELKNQTYLPTPVRQIWVPKPRKKEKRPLCSRKRNIGIPDFKDRLVGEAIRMVLNSIYEPYFSDLNCNHGFRPGKGCHTAIEKIKKSAANGKHIALEADIKGAYPSLDHNILLSILRRKITDTKFLKLIRKLLDAGIYDSETQVTNFNSFGVPQGQILSPILWNIYFSAFDEYIINTFQKYIDKYNIKKKRYTCTKGYRSKRIEASIYGTRQKLVKLKNNSHKRISEWSPDKKALYNQIKSSYVKACKERSKKPSVTLSKQKIRYEYVRYADDWVLFTNASPSIVQIWKRLFSLWLKTNLKLTLDQVKTKITNTRSNPVKFLGFNIRQYSPQMGIIKYIDGIPSNRRITSKPHITSDRERYLERYCTKGLVMKKKRGEKKGQYFPKGKFAWSIQPIEQIIQTYNSVIRGISYYYFEFTTKSDLDYIVYLLNYSCIFCICKKLKLSCNKVIKKYGFHKEFQHQKLPIVYNQEMINEATKEKQTKKHALLTLDMVYKDFLALKQLNEEDQHKIKAMIFSGNGECNDPLGVNFAWSKLRLE